MQIDTGDVVHHGPTGEDWTVAYVRDGRLAWCGWPGPIGLFCGKTEEWARLSILMQADTMGAKGDNCPRWPDGKADG